LRRFGYVAVAVADRDPHDLGHCSHLLMGSLYGNSIGDAGARDLGAALQVNTTLTTLMCGSTSALQARGTWARRCRSTRR
jgi:hypothetical protein